jgi:hypothetical protein
VIALNSTSNPQHQNFITFSTIPNCCGRTVPEPPMLPLVLTVAGLAVLIQTRRRTRVGGNEATPARSRRVPAARASGRASPLSC